MSDEDLVVLLLHNANVFEPFLIRAAAELLRCRPIAIECVTRAARRERCERVLAYIAHAGAHHDSDGAVFWTTLVAAFKSQRAVAPGVLPHWSRFVALEGVDRGRRQRAKRWIGATA